MVPVDRGSLIVLVEIDKGIEMQFLRWEVYVILRPQKVLVEREKRFETSAETEVKERKVRSLEKGLVLLAEVRYVLESRQAWSFQLV